MIGLAGENPQRSAAIAHPNHLIGGGVENPAPENVYAAAGQAITEAVDAFYNPVGKAPRFFPGLNFALERDRYRTIGGFDREFGRLAAEDRDFFDRWRMAGGRLMACPQAIVRHEHRSSLSGFVRQVFNYGRGAWRYHSLRRMRNSGSMSEDISINFQLARYFRNTLRGQPPFRRIGIIILLGVWQVANLAGFVWQASLELRINIKIIKMRNNSRPLDLFWWKPKRGGFNLGDELGRLVFERYFGMTVQHKNLAEAEAMSVGSILGWPVEKNPRSLRNRPLHMLGTILGLPVMKNLFAQRTRPLHVLGSGFIHGDPTGIASKGIVVALPAPHQLRQAVKNILKFPRFGVHSLKSIRIAA